MPSTQDLFNSPIPVAVHDGAFHADDVASIALLKALGWNGHTLRSRNPIILQNKLCIDVGAGPYDHHGSAASRDKKFGYPHSGLSLLLSDPEIQKRITSRYPTIKTMDSLISRVAKPVAIEDNGKGSPQHPFSWVPAFNADLPRMPRPSDKKFDNSVATAKQIWLALLIQEAKRQADQRVVERLLQNNEQIITIPRGLSGWEGPAASTNARFAVIPSAGSWQLKSIQKPGKRFSKKTPFPKAWRGKSGEELERVTGLPGSIFCHNEGFLAGFRNRETCLAAARKLLKKRK